MIWLLSSLFKLLLFPTYRSTDFSVHAHWLFVTRYFPISEWYSEETSRWTLDYPPLFAWFEFMLSHIGFPPSDLLSNKDEPVDCFRRMVSNEDPTCFHVNSVIWHRVSVIVTEFLVLNFAVLKYCKTWPVLDHTETSFSTPKQTLTLALLAFDPNLILVDHIHFQYNGFLLGVLILSLVAIRTQDDVWAAFLFSGLLLCKHIFLYAAPLYFVYLLARIWPPSTTVLNSSALAIFLKKLLSLGLVVIVTAMVSFGSVCSTVDCLQQVFSRLFPVTQRGLLHAYWAPNFWALYAGMDKILFRIMGSSSNHDDGTSSSYTLGLVQEHVSFHVLKPVSPLVTLVCTVVSMLPTLYVVWRCPKPPVFLLAYCSCVLSGFFFGYHVHEKALLMVSLPLALIACDSVFEARLYWIFTMTSFVCLCPLLFVQELIAVKFLLAACFGVCSWYGLDAFHLERKQKRRIAHQGLGTLIFGNPLCALYLTGLGLVWAFFESGVLAKRYPFLSLMAVSMYGALGVLGCWIELFMLLRKKERAIASYQYVDDK